MDEPGSVRILDENGHMAWLPPPPNDGQRYVLTYDFPQNPPGMDWPRRVWCFLG